MTHLINRDDKEFYGKQYAVVLNRHAETMLVYADSDGDALDEAIDYAWDRGWVGYFLAPEQALELESEGYIEDYAQGGNEGRYLSSFNVSLVDVTGDDWDGIAYWDGSTIVRIGIE